MTYNVEKELATKQLRQLKEVTNVLLHMRV